ncbi:MAG: hypothetical protein KFF49_00535 [Bacteroidales bacterium]|nr:hypothetical protein [Bacteroidales bacterium]
MEIEEGKRYDFLVEKTVSLGAKSYYLLKGPDDIKYLLRKDLFEHYNIYLNSFINCRVDKINCRGEVFLEPVNPYYEEGKEYEFRITGRDIRVEESGELTPVLLLADKFSREQVIPMNRAGSVEVMNNDYITLRVSRINKGRILFTDPEKEIKGDKKQEDKVYEFFIFDRMTGVDGKEYFIVSDQNDSHYLLPAKQYSYYGLEKGRTFMGRFIKYHSTGKYKIEPVNPYYQPGKQYTFHLVSSLDKPDGPGKVLVVGDEYGLKHEVFVTEDYCPADKLVLKVEKIRKGWPLLVPV